MPNQICTFHFTFIFFHEFLRARESNLVNVFVNFLSSHTDTTVDDAQGFFFFIQLNVDGQIAELAFGFAQIGQCF